MARPIKEGLDYASLDCDYFLDPKLMKVEEEMGTYARLIYIDVILYAKSEHGYWALFDADNLRVFCRGRGHNAIKTQKVVAALVNAGLFDKDIWARHQVLTCTRMQNEYALIKRKNKAKVLIRHPEFTLAQTELSHVQTRVYPEETEFTTSQSTQRKEKESKETPPTPSQNPPGVVVSEFLGEKCLEDLCEIYGVAPVYDLINELQDYVNSSGKRYANYEAALQSWAKRKLTPIPAWEKCTNPECHHGWVLKRQDNELVSVPCPTCKQHNNERTQS